MLKQEGGGSAGGVGVGSIGGLWARLCDSCRASASVVYCRADMAYLCAGCDARIHAANRVASRHDRVWVCEACEKAPAAFTCKADAASLCTTCDADIHSANPLARRHQRVPVQPISGCLYGPPATLLGRSTAGVVAAGDSFLGQEEIEAIEKDGQEEEEEGDDETESWLLLNNPVQVKNNNHNQSSGNGYLFGGGDVDEYFDLVEYNNSCTSNDRQYSVHHHHHHQHFNNPQQNQLELETNNNNDASDSVVPVHHHHQQQQQQNFQLEMEYEAAKVGFGYAGTIDFSNTISLSSMDASIVPDSTVNDISNSHSRPPKGTIDLFSSPPIQIPAHQCTPMDREARVLRYREKRKTRKFEKTIRYASRKAYAETRPRIKGRFAKRTDVEVEVDQMFSTSLMADTEYGIVPSF